MAAPSEADRRATACGYGYIARAYGRRFEAGQLVTLDELGGAEGRVLKAIGDPMYVRVAWEAGGKRHRGEFHPLSITVKA